MDEKMPVDRSETSKNSARGDTSPTSSASADAAAKSPTRRRLLQAGAGLVAAATGASRGVAAPMIAGQSVIVPRAPNIVVLMTDQERHHMHWPPGWAEKNLPSLQRLKRNGLYFLRAYTAACECSPSRGVMQTGRFAPINRVPSTAVLWPGLVHQDHQPTIASLLKAHAGYDVVWKGKWHLSYASNAAPGNGGEDWGPADIKVMEANWGWSDWNPPDAGTAIQQAQGTPFGVFNGNNTAGGGNPNNDGRYVSGDINATPGQIRGVGGESVVEFLKGGKGSSNPFCLFVSLVNPHDIGVYPGNLITPPAWQQVGYRREDFAHLGIKLPPNYADDLSTKPSIQKLARDNYNKFAPLGGPEGEEEYINFYAYLHKVVDKHITTVLDTLEETGLMDNTIILRFADHGEPRADGGERAARRRATRLRRGRRRAPAEGVGGEGRGVSRRPQGFCDMTRRMRFGACAGLKAARAPLDESGTLARLGEGPNRRAGGPPMRSPLVFAAFVALALAACNAPAPQAGPPPAPGPRSPARRHRA